MDAEGGEKLEAMAELYRTMAERAVQYHSNNEAYYFLDQTVLAKFKMFQGFEPDWPLAGSPIQQAWWIWDCGNISVTEALIRANLPNYAAK
jgi:hypothetical protein